MAYVDVSEYTTQAALMTALEAATTPASTYTSELTAEVTAANAQKAIALAAAPLEFFMLTGA
jgi:hypothetical protein